MDEALHLTVAGFKKLPNVKRLKKGEIYIFKDDDYLEYPGFYIGKYIGRKEAIGTYEGRDHIQDHIEHWYLSLDGYPSTKKAPRAYALWIDWLLRKQPMRFSEFKEKFLSDKF